MSVARMRAVGLPLLTFLLAATASAWIVLAAQTVEVRIKDLAFDPPDVTAHVGDTVRWVNTDFVDHTVTASNGDWDLALPAGATALLKPTKPGTFDYICTVHPNMTGKLHVTGK